MVRNISHLSVFLPQQLRKAWSRRLARTIARCRLRPIGREEKPRGRLDGIGVLLGPEAASTDGALEERARRLAEQPVIRQVDSRTARSTSPCEHA